VLSGETEYGILPIENSLSGSIHENYDLLLQYPDCGIVGEKKIRIVHALFGRPGSTIEGLTRIYSHPQGRAQCGRFLEGISAVFHPYYDTAGSVAFIAKEGNPAYGAIASVEAAKVHGMSVLKEGIETNPRNYTRFFIIRRREQGEPEEWNKASLVFAVPDTPGSLFECLRAVAERKLNMKKLESRPIQGKPWQYMFYFDVEVGSEKDALRKALDELSRKAIDLRILGQYRGD
jgi:prephenate dehydratase